MNTIKVKKVQLSGNQKPYLDGNNSLQLFYNDIRPYKQLSKEETKKLFKLYHSGTKEERDFAFDKIYKHNLRLVVSLARDYCSSDDNLNDLIQEGGIGLMKAIEMFDEDNGTPFAGYSLYWIRRYINIFKTNVTPMIQQTNRSKTANVIVTISNELCQKFERIPTPDEILDEYNNRYPNRPINDSDNLVNVEYIFIDQFESVNETTQNLNDYSDYNSASVSYNDYIKEIESDHNKKMLSILINKLSDKEAKIIRMLYGVDGYTKTNINIIGLEMGLSSQRVSQICKTALKKLKTISNKLSYSFT